MNVYKIKPAVLICMAIILVGTFCAGCSPFNRTQRGAAIGAGAGATVGAVIGKTAGNVALGSIIGGAIGGTAGAYLAHKVDNPPVNLKHDIPGAKVVRNGNDVLIKFDAPIQFEQGAIDLKPEGQTDVKTLAVTLHDNPQTSIVIIGHTDNLGSEDYNMDLSIKRAQAVKSALVNYGIEDARITTIGKGSTQPVADNNTREGRAENRSVEIVISNSDIKERAAQNNK